MNRILTLSVIIFFGFTSNLLSQRKMRSFPVVSRNETPKFVNFSSDGRFITTGIWGEVRVWELVKF